MRKRQLILFYLLIITSFFFSGCTENILDSQPILASKNQITGTVKLNARQNAEGIYVWLEGLNIGQMTDENGEFKLEIPQFLLQEYQSRLTGVFNLYYYSANFNLESTQLFFRNGSLASHQDVISGDGELRKPQVVLQNLRIKTLVVPESVSSAEVVQGELRRQSIVVILKVTLQALLGPLTIKFPTAVGNLISPVIFRNVNTDEVVILESRIAGLSVGDVLTLREGPVSRYLIIELLSHQLSKGEYEVIPYLLIDQSLPQGLLESLGENVEELGPNYLKMPILRETSRFVLTD
ncbi:hypothetical protein IIA28_15435 [candidate division KSB1 bacterium]|nr:hypothetical protein [candidate division KSB1 bacterium]